MNTLCFFQLNAQMLPLEPDHDLQVQILTPGYPQIGHGDAVSLEKIIHESKLKVQRVSRKYRAVPRSSFYHNDDVDNFPSQVL